MEQNSEDSILDDDTIQKAENPAHRDTVRMKSGKKKGSFWDLLCCALKMGLFYCT